MRNLSSRFFFFFEFLKGENRSFDYVYIVSFVIEVLEIFKRDFFREMIIDLNIKNRYEFRFLLFDDYLNFEGENFEGENFKGCSCDIYIVSFAKSSKHLRKIFRGMIIDLNIRNRYEFRFLLFDDYLNFEGENFENCPCDIY